MRRLLVLASTLFFCVGCASDQREGLTSHAVDLLSQTTSKIISIRERIEEAMKKSDKGLNLSEAVRAAEDLKAKGKELQATSNAISTLREAITDEERQQYQEKFKSRVQSEVKKLDEQTILLDQKFRELERMATDQASKAAVEELGKKLKEAEAEYYGLARQQR